MNRNFFLLSGVVLVAYLALLPESVAYAEPRLRAPQQTLMLEPMAQRAVSQGAVASRSLGVERADQADQLAVPRILTETALGYGMGFVSQLLGMFVGITAGCLGATATRESCGWSMLIGGSLGNVFVTPLGTIIMGNAFRGNGNYLGALLGSLAGTALEYAIGVPFVLSAPSRGEIEIALYLSALLPAIGATIGYELQSDMRNNELRNEGITVVPTLQPTFAADGRGMNGAIVGASFSNF